MAGQLEPHRLPEGIHTQTLDYLTIRRRAFVLHYVLGEVGVRGTAYKAYFAAGYEASSKQVASAGAYQLLQDPQIKAAIEEVQKEVEKEAKARIRSFAVMAVNAAEVLDAAVQTMAEPELTEEEVAIEKATGAEVPKTGFLRDGRRRTYLTSEQLSVLKEVFDRALGRPKQTSELEIGERLDDTIRRLSDQANEKLPPPKPALQSIGDVGEEGEFIPRVVDDSDG